MGIVKQQVTIEELRDLTKGVTFKVLSEGTSVGDYIELEILALETNTVYLLKDKLEKVSQQMERVKLH